MATDTILPKSLATHPFMMSLSKKVGGKPRMKTTTRLDGPHSLPCINLPFPKEKGIVMYCRFGGSTVDSGGKTRREPGECLVCDVLQLSFESS